MFEIFVRDKDNNIKCVLCNEKLPIIKSSSKLEARLTTFQHPHMPILGPSIGEFPNAFWDLKHSLRVCPLCAYLIIHHHIPFKKVKGNKYQIFINANSFKVMWYLNKFAENVLKNMKNENSIKKILGLSLIEFSQRIYATLGVWSMASIEVVIKEDNNIDYYSLPYDIVSILLNSEVSKLINEINEPVVLDKILAGDFDHLLDIAYHVIRKLYSKDNSENNRSNLILKELSKNANYQKLAYKLPELYAKINSIIRGGIR